MLCVMVCTLSLIKSSDKKRKLHLWLSFLKLFFSTVFIVFNFIFAHRGIGKGEKIQMFADYFNNTQIVENEMRHGFKRYFLQSVITDMNFYVKLFYYFCATYALLTLFQIIRLVYKTCIRIRLRRQTQIAKQKLLD